MACQNALVCTQNRRMIAVVSTVVFLIGVVVLAFLLAKNHHASLTPENWQGNGTTGNLYEIFLGRCYEYITMINPDAGNKDCRKMLQMLETSVMNKNQCDITAVDYQTFMEVSSYPILCNRSLFWSKTYDLAHRYVNAAQKKVITLEDTLLGYITNGLSWCGTSYTSELNYQSCPSKDECESNPVSVFWKTASEHFAKQACGVVHVMLNGSTATGTIQPNSIFWSVEVPNLDPLKITEVQIWVMDNIDGPDRDSCSSRNQTELQNTLKERNISSSCVDNYWPVHILQCVRTPDESVCKLNTR
ncbi:ADP-ribosyl cyclase/cyclic ADP-ribose hydrolase 1-like [Lissotriton helveticus]